MGSSSQVLISPSSDEKLWSRLRDRVESILDQQSPKHQVKCIESERSKRQREDSILLIRGLDSAAASLSQLTRYLNVAQQGLISLQQKESHVAEHDETGPRPKRHRRSVETQKKDEEETTVNNEVSTQKKIKEEIKANNEMNHHESGEDQSFSINVDKSANMKKAKSMAICLASKAALLAKELKAIKSELYFVQGRCNLLEEENRRLRDGLQSGARSDDDDLVRLQLEALLTEKSRLANENATLTRENECLQQLVEYHQLAQEDIPSPSSYEQSIRGVCLDFEDCHSGEECT